MTLDQTIARFGAAVTAKRGKATTEGAAEDQLRAPLETLLQELAALAHFKLGQVVAIGEATMTARRVRPDYAIEIDHALVGFVELKAPGKGADPRRFRDKHDREQWERLKSLPNLLYTDGNSFAVWRDGILATDIVRLDGDVETDGARLRAPPALERLIGDFLRWEPQAPESAQALAKVSARLCRLLRDEVTEQLEAGSASLTGLAADWRVLLFPQATNKEFADGYAQAVVFGLLMARARNISLKGGLDQVAKSLAATNTLIGNALKVLTDDVTAQASVRTSLGTLTRVLEAVDWAVIGRGDPEAWLYFYEAFLDVYDRALRRQTGSYYTPPEVVTAMVRLVDEALRDPARFNVPRGLAADTVTIADPATGTGTYPLGILRRIAETTRDDQGAGAIPATIRAALRRIIGFEMQFGPYAVAQLRLTAEIAALFGAAIVPADAAPRLYVTDTLGNPFAEEGYIPTILRPLAESRRQANAIKRQEPITVVIGNPPYKEKAKGRGGWIEARTPKTEKDRKEKRDSPLDRWIPPAAWGVGAHAKHLRNLYVYFWRWATWKVFGDTAPSPAPSPDTMPDGRGIVCFITVAGFLNGPGFEAMRADLRRSCDEIFVIDCSPEGHQPAVSSRVFQGVQQPVCIVLAARTRKPSDKRLARVRFRALPAGRREDKFEELAALTLDRDGWVDGSAGDRAPFLPAMSGGWADYPALEALFCYNGSGVMPGRTWAVSPDSSSLSLRWDRLIGERDLATKQELFHPKLRKNKLASRHVEKTVHEHLGSITTPKISIAVTVGPCPTVIRYGFRSLDRQWLIADARLLNDTRPELWPILSPKQVFLTALGRTSPRSGPAVTFTELVPDQDHYKGSFGGRVFPLWADAAATTPNLSLAYVATLAATYGTAPPPEDAFAYLAAIAAHPAYTGRFAPDLVQPGLRIPLTADPTLFAEAAAIGREVLWLHTYGERFSNPAEGRPAGPPRLPQTDRPTIPAAGAIPDTEDGMPNTIAYTASLRRLHVGSGYIDNVPPEVWAYEVSGKQIVPQWFSYRGRDRSRPIIGDRRKPSPLGDIRPKTWLAEYTTDLLDLLNVLGLLVRLEPRQANLLTRVCAGTLISARKLAEAAPATSPAKRPRRGGIGGDLLDTLDPPG